MYVYLELWKAKPKWHEMSVDERVAYMEKLGPGIQELLGAGIEIVAWGENDPDTAHRADFDYYAVWRMSDKEQVRVFEDTVEQAGWYDYMEQVNACGSEVGPEAVIARQIAG